MAKRSGAPSNQYAERRDAADARTDHRPASRRRQSAIRFLFRGFDSDHGTDFAVFIDGIPVNMVSHAHGQGYADLHWLIPETIERVEIYKGPYFPQLGDFATSGAMNIITKKTRQRQHAHA